MRLEIAVSTLNDGIKNIEIRQDYNYLIVHQVTDGNDYSRLSSSLPDNVRYIISYDKGLSKSRNLALDNTIADYVWIMDDDVSIREGAYSHIMSLCESYPDCGMLVVSHSHELIDYLPGNRYKYLSDVSAANVSSIDMIINMKACKAVRFDERFGLGSEYPSGEEYIFTCNIISAGYKVIKSRFVCAYHPPLSSGQDFYSTANKLKAKLEMFKVANGVMKGYVYYLAFLIRKANVLLKGKAMFNVFKSFF